MGMATNTDNDEQIKTEFCSLSSFFNEVKAKWFADAESFRELSMECLTITTKPLQPGAP